MTWIDPTLDCNEFDKLADEPLTPTKGLPVQAVKRAFALLEMLNQHNGATVRALSDLARLPRGTVHRILETLRSLGYVEKDPHALGYWVGTSAKGLSRGYSDQTWVFDTGERIVQRLYRKTSLSAVLTTPDDGEAEMVVRIATVLRNPAGGHRTTAGMRISMGRTCSGHSYLAHCAPALREQLLDKLYGRKNVKRGYIAFSHNNNFALERPYTDKILASIRRQGYAVGHLSRDPSGKVAVIAVPILGSNEVIGTLSLNCYYSALTAASLKGHVALLKDAAAELADDRNTARSAPYGGRTGVQN